MVLAPLPSFEAKRDPQLSEVALAMSYDGFNTTKTYIEVEAPPFLDRMELDTNSRRKNKFINELSESRRHRRPMRPARAHVSVAVRVRCAEKHPAFKPSMLEEPKVRASPGRA